MPRLRRTRCASLERGLEKFCFYRHAQTSALGLQEIIFGALWTAAAGWVRIAFSVAPWPRNNSLPRLCGHEGWAVRHVAPKGGRGRGGRSFPYDERRHLTYTRVAKRALLPEGSKHPFRQILYMV